MWAYVYQAALICGDCANKIRDIVGDGESPAMRAIRESEDSNVYPQFASRDGGGEADTPQHCDHCGVHLENPLTSEGYKYIAEKFVDARVEGKLSDILRTWWNYYGSDHTPGIDMVEPPLASRPVTHVDAVKLLNRVLLALDAGDWDSDTPARIAEIVGFDSGDPEWPRVFTPAPTPAPITPTPAPVPGVCAMMDMSTAHVYGLPNPDFGCLRFVEHEHGFTVFIPGEAPSLDAEPGDADFEPVWMRDILARAREVGAYIVNFDGDADIVAGFPVYGVVVNGVTS